MYVALALGPRRPIYAIMSYLPRLRRPRPAPPSIPRRSRVPLVALLGSVLMVGWAFPALAACTDPAAAGVNWRRCYMDGRDLKKVPLAGAMLRDTTFQRSDLSDADLSGVDGYRAKFMSATLAGTLLNEARLIEADFTRADMTRVSLKGADLRNAKLVGATLTGADLTGARLDGADLRNADLSGALWIDGQRRCGAGSTGQCH